MNTAKNTAFLGLRIPEEAKAKLEQEAGKQGVSVTELCKRLLAAGVNGGDGDDAGNVARPAGPSTVDDQDSMIEDIKRLENMRTELNQMVDERQGLFDQAPESLRIARRSVESRIQGLSKKLHAMIPAGERKKGHSWWDWDIFDQLFPR